MKNILPSLQSLMAWAALSALAISPASAQEGGAPTKPASLEISAEFPFESHYVEVMGSSMHYIDEGDGDPVLFLHGNPTSSYLWRNIIPYAVPYGRAIALDLIGMGKSDKPDIDYRFVTHAEYLQGFIDALDLNDITLVIHDWGSALGMDFARRNPERVKGIVFMEPIAPPAMPIPSYEAMGEGPGEFFRNVRTPGVGEEIVLQQNVFVEVVMPEMGTVRALTDAEREAYREPYPTPKSRLPTLVWPREVPIAGEPADVLKIIEANGRWLHQTDMPKLMFYAEPGAFGTPEVAAYYAENLKNIETRYVGVGIHYIQEDQPLAIGRGLSDWLRRHQ